MNKVVMLLVAQAVMGSAVACLAAAVVNLNNYESNVPIMYQPEVGAPIVIAPAIGTYVQLLAGPVGGPLQPVTINATSESIINGIDEGGFFDEGVGVIPGMADRAQADFMLRAWVGAATFDVAAAKMQTGPWTQATGSWDLTSSPPGTPESITLRIPAGGLTITGPFPVTRPEPSTLALGLLGAAAMWIWRR